MNKAEFTEFMDWAKEQTISKKKPCGLDYCPQEEIVGAYASCSACAWGNDCDDKLEEEVKGADND